MNNLPNIIDYSAIAQPSNPLEINIGVAQNIHNGELVPVKVDFGNNLQSSLLVAGSAGGGKSNLLHVMICTLAQRSPENSKLILFDFKRVELMPFYENLNFPHFPYGKIFTTDEEFSDVILQLYWLVSNGELNDEHVFVFVDEFAQFMLNKSVSDARMERIISALTRLATPDNNVHLIFSTQRPDKRVLSDWLRACIPCRVAYSCAAVSESLVILGNDSAAFREATPSGRAVIGYGHISYLFQTLHVTDQKKVEIVEKCKAQHT